MRVLSVSVLIDPSALLIEKQSYPIILLGDAGASQSRFAAGRHNDGRMLHGAVPPADRGSALITIKFDLKIQERESAVSVFNRPRTLIWTLDVLQTGQ